MELLEDQGRYGRLFRKINYFNNDIARYYIFSVVSQFMPTSQMHHWDAMFRILQYLKSAPRK